MSTEFSNDFSNETYKVNMNEVSELNKEFDVLVKTRQPKLSSILFFTLYQFAYYLGVWQKVPLEERITRLVKVAEPVSYLMCAAFGDEGDDIEEYV